MHLLPTTLGRLADLCSDTPRWATSGVHVVLRPDNTFVAEATDAKGLVRVTGPCVGDPAAYPDLPALTAAPNGRTDALIPGGVWRKTFAAADKLTRRGRTRANLRAVAVKLGAEVATFGMTDLETSPVESCRLVDGRFPPAADILPRPGRGKDAVRVDPVLLADVLRVVAAACPVPDSGATASVTIETYGPDKPVAIRCESADGLRVSALVMPLAGRIDDGGADTAADAGELDRLRAENRALAAERDDLAARLRASEDLAAGRFADLCRANAEVERLRRAVDGETPPAAGGRPLTRRERLRGASA